MNMPTNELTSLQIFKGIAPEEATTICDALQEMSFSAGEEILTEGDDTQALWIILSGECVVSRSCSVNDVRILANLNAGDVFGEMSFVRTAPHSATIKATSDVTVCCYSRAHFRELKAKFPDAVCNITANIAAVLAERLRRMDTWVCEMVDGPKGDDYRDEWQTFRSAVYTNWNF